VSRIDQIFSRLRAKGERALVAYFTAGDPSVEVTEKVVCAAVENGADLIELGFPFSDPLADGPVIQRASQRALQHGMNFERLIRLIELLRARVQAPLVVMTYVNPILRRGGGVIAKDLVQAGLDGLIIPDLPPDESGELGKALRQSGLDLIYLAAPTSSPERLRLIARRSQGFIYLVSLTGVTGARDQLPPDLIQHLRDLRAVTKKPICVGFGISTPEHARVVGEWADGVVVGSAIVRLIEEHASSPDLIRRVGHFIQSLKAPLESRGSGSGARGSQNTKSDPGPRTPDPGPPTP